MFPLSLETKLIAGALALAALLGGFLYIEHLGAEKVRQAQAVAEARAIAANQAESARRDAAVKDAGHEAERFQAVADTAARDARDADVRLRQRLASRAAPVDPAASGAGASADPTATVPFDVFAGIDDASGQLATYADQLRISLGACIASYGALTAP